MTCSWLRKDQTLRKKVHDGVAATHQMVEDMDSEVNIDKSALMANTPNTRKALKKYLWGLREEQVVVYQHARDLGSHLNTLRVPPPCGLRVPTSKWFSSSTPSNYEQ